MPESKSLFAILTALLMTGGTVWYCYIFAKGGVKPSLMSWLLFSVATGLALSAYATAKYSFVSNAANTADALSCILAFFFIFFRGGYHTGTSTTNKRCLWATAGIIAFWVVTRSHSITNLAAQTILLVAYIPTIEKLWHHPENQEPIGPWIAFWLASIISIVPAFSSESNILAKSYAIRATLCTSTLLLLNLRASKLAFKKEAAR